MMSSILIGGCQKHACIPVQTGPVVFKAFFGNETKSGIIDADSASRPLTDVEGIQIIRGADGENPAFNEVPQVNITGAIKAGSDVLTPSPSQHFPLDANGIPLDEDINFFAYYPEGDSYTAGTGDTPAEVAWNLYDGLTDIIYTLPAEGNYYEDSKEGNDIDFRFVHALSRLSLKIIAEDYDSYITFKSVTSAKIMVPFEVRMMIDKNGNAKFLYGPEDRSGWKEIDFCKNAQKLPIGYPKALDESLDILIPPIEDNYSFRFCFEGLGEVDKEYVVENLPLVPGKTTVLTITVRGGVLMLMAPYVEMYDPVKVDGPIVIE